MTEVVTGEAVVLDLAVARFPSRIAAQLIDILVQLPVLLFIEIVVIFIVIICDRCRRLTKG